MREGGRGSRRRNDVGDGVGVDADDDMIMLMTDEGSPRQWWR